MWQESELTVMPFEGTKAEHSSQWHVRERLGGNCNPLYEVDFVVQALPGAVSTTQVILTELAANSLVPTSDCLRYDDALEHI